MITLALDTSTHGGSVAVVQDGRPLAERSGPPEVPHARRLPGDIIEVLRAAEVPLQAIDLFAVASGPGAFTGLRIGIATMQGLAFAHNRPIVGVSALEALAQAATWPSAAPPDVVAACMDAARGEVFTALYERRDDGLACIDDAAVGAPSSLVERWVALVGGRCVAWVGDGAVRYRPVFQSLGARDVPVADPVPRLATVIGRLAQSAAAAGLAGPPHALHPLYVRRPDAEIARDRLADAGRVGRP